MKESLEEEKDRACTEPVHEEEVNLLGNLEFERRAVLESGSAGEKWREETVEKDVVVASIG